MPKRPTSPPRAETRAKPRASRKPPEPERLPAIAPATGRHREILEAAMELIAERGYAGASLRELARRVGMQQPSLYHYFATKEEMVEQILVTFYHAMLAGGVRVIPAALEQLPRSVGAYVKALYSTRTHPLFLRCIVAVSRVSPRFGRINRAIFVDDVEAQSRLALAPFIARGELTEPEAVLLTRMLTSAFGFRMMEERVLFDERPLGPEIDAYIDFVAAASESWIRELKARNAGRAR